MVAEFEMYENIEEEMFSRPTTRSLVLDAITELEDEKGIRREQFNTMSNCVDKLHEEMEHVEQCCTKAYDLAVIAMAIGGVSICVNILNMIVH